MIKEKIFCGLDIGSKKVKSSLIRKKKGGKFELLAVHDEPVVGIDGLSVRDLNELSRSILTVLKKISKKTNQRIKCVQLGVCGHFVTPRYSGTIIPLLDRGSKVISRSDIRRINKQVCLLGLKMEEEVLHYFPQKYIVDDLTESINPQGLHGRKLAMESLLMVANTNVINNVVKSVNQAGYDVVNTFFSSLAAAEACLPEIRKKEGYVLIDIGADLTSILFFDGSNLRQLEIIPLGGGHITKSIAEELIIPFDLAEDIKTSYAVAHDDGDNGSHEILIKREKIYKPIKQSTINRAVTPMIKELVSLIRERIVGSKNFINLKKVVAIGGGVLLPGLIESIENELNISVKMGKIQIALTRLNKPAFYASSVGLALLGARSTKGHPAIPFTKEAISRTLIEKIQEFYQEYF